MKAQTLFHTLLVVVISLVQGAICSSVAWANEGDTLWTRTYGGSDNDYSNALISSGDGGYLLAGLT